MASSSSSRVSPVRRALLLSSFLFCFLPRHVAAGATGAGGYVTVSTAGFADSSATCDEPAGPGSAAALAFLGFLGEMWLVAFGIGRVVVDPFVGSSDPLLLQ